MRWIFATVILGLMAGAAVGMWRGPVHKSTRVAGWKAEAPVDSEDALRRRVCRREGGLAYIDEHGVLQCVSMACKMQLW